MDNKVGPQHCRQPNKQKRARMLNWCVPAVAGLWASQWERDRKRFACSPKLVAGQRLKFRLPAGRRSLLWLRTSHLAASMRTQGPAQQTSGVRKKKKNSPDRDIARVLAPCLNIAPPDLHPRHPASPLSPWGVLPRPWNYGDPKFKCLGNWSAETASVTPEPPAI